MEQIYATILKTGEKQQAHLKKFSELFLVQDNTIEQTIVLLMTEVI